MKVIMDSNSEKGARAGCVCYSGWKSTRGPWQPIWNCNCTCNGSTTNKNANFAKAKSA